MKELKETIEKAREEVNNIINIPLDFVEFKKMLKEKLGKELDIEDTSEFFMFNDWDELLHILSLVAEKQREECSKQIRKPDFLFDPRAIILATPLITEQLKQKP